MGLYNVVASCVVGKLHYARPTTHPIEVDDAVAAPLVESGCLERYGSAKVPELKWPTDALLPERGSEDERAAEVLAQVPVPSSPDSYLDGSDEVEDAAVERVAEPKPRRGRRKD